MKPENKALRSGAIAIAFAVALRLAAYAFPDAAAQVLQSPNLHKALVFLSTGRVLVHRPQPTEPDVTQPPVTEPAPTEPAPTQPARPAFTQADAELTSISGNYKNTVDKESLLTQPLDWDLTVDAPTVLIVHTHGSESYENTEGYTPSSAYRTLDENYNMLSIGDHVAKKLQDAGITVLHDRQLHDYPSYNGAYTNSRKSVRTYLEENPSICLVLDLHRDAAEDASGKQISYTVESKYGKTAKLMMVMGKDTSARPHKNWQENLSLALKLQVQLERECPGITRAVSLWASRLNQDLCPGAVLVEVGAAGNTRQEALNAAELLADAVISLAAGSA